jgi:drug/metabolite transporter (DMT)-like permease
VSGLAVLLALASSLAWGAADFSGGLVSRRAASISVAVVSQLAGFLALLVALAVRGGALDWRSFALGLASGAGGGLGLAAFYEALSHGTMSIVSPIAGCGALVPFTLGLATGERPSTIALAGAIVALAGAVVASTEERRITVGAQRRAVGLALVAAVTFGVFFYFMGLGSRHGEVLSTLVGARVGSLACLVPLALLRSAPLRLPRALVLPVVAIGLCDVSANALFAFASGHGLLALVSVLGSLYPVTTVLLAHVVLGERLTPLQLMGVGVALAGVAALSVG